MGGSGAELADRVATHAAEPVLTHGEPHPGNVMRVGPQLMLIDWDTLGLALPERDLMHITSADGEDLRRYADVTGRSVDPDALALYRLRWTLDDISAFLRQLRSRHPRDAHTEQALRCLRALLAGQGQGGG